MSPYLPPVDAEEQLQRELDEAAEKVEKESRARTILVAGDEDGAHVRRSTFSRLMAPLAIAASAAPPLVSRVFGGRAKVTKKRTQLEEWEREERRRRRLKRRKGPWRPRGAARWRGAAK